MILPKNGRIVVIDDKTEEEAMPLLKALNKNGFSAMYFSGNKKELPSKPFNDVRVVFLDMELVEGSDEKAKGATTAKVLSSIIDTSIYTIYLLIIWARHEELLKYFWKYLNTGATYNCVFKTVSLNKEECSANDYDISYIENEINQKLLDCHGFRFLFNWENIVHQSSNDSIYDLLALLENGGEIENKLLRIIKNLAIAYAGDHVNDITGQIVKNAMLAFNSVYKDSLESNTMDVQDNGFDFNGITVIQNKKLKAAINSKLLLCNNSLNPKPGNVYLEKNDELHKEVCSELVTKATYLNDVKANSQLISCEVSPVCDYIQQKWRVGRLVFGLFLDHDYYKRIKDADYLYKTPLLEHGDNIGHFIFDMRRAETKKLGRWRKEIISSMRYDMVVDLQHKIGGHCSRPGMIYL